MAANVSRIASRALALGAAVVFAVSAAADNSPSAEACKPHAALPIERLLRRVSIDVRGVVPAVEEYDKVKGLTAVPADIVDAYLASDAFRVQMRRYHELMLWTNPTAILTNVNFGLSGKTFPSGNVVYGVTSTGQRKKYRGGDGTHTCLDQEQSTLPNGGVDPVTGGPSTIQQADDAVGPVFAEGWVEVAPYWAPNTTIKVCAFDAQTTETYTLPPGDANAGVHTCDEALADGKSQSCGCGPNLDYCLLASNSQLILDSMREQLLRSVDDATSGKNPYSTLLTAKRAYINGPLVHYFKYLAARQSLGRVQDMYRPEDGVLPDLKFTDKDTWVAIDREAPHSGILTLPAYLLRFQTNRGRANRYRIAFEGQYFQPPSTKDSECNTEGEDLTKRCVCRNCHSTLEPMAAYFGTFTEAGTMSVAGFDRSFNSYKTCSASATIASGTWCDRFYVPVADTGDPDIRPYKLRALRYDDADHPLIGKHFDDGPLGLATSDIETGIFHKVAARQLFEFLMKREANLDPTSTDFEGETLDQLAADFQKSDNLPELIKAIIALPAYGRTP